MSGSVRRRVVVDGRLSSDGSVCLDADDPALLLGVDVFETLRTYHGRPFRLDEHLARLEHSAAWLDIPFPGRAVLARDVALALEGMTVEANVRITLTGGGRRVVRAAPLGRFPPVQRCVTRRFTPPPWLPGHVKHGSRAGSAVAVARAGADEVIWVDEAGHLLEGTRSNVVAVVDGAFWTPPLDGRILNGVTRGALIEAARMAGITVREEPLPANGPHDELYLTSTLRELVPVVELDGQPAAGAGPVGKLVLETFRERIRPGPAGE